MNTAIQTNRPIRQLNVEPRVRKIKAEIEKVEEEEAQATLGPIERPDDTFVVTNLKARKERLLDELARLQQIVDTERSKDSVS